MLENYLQRKDVLELVKHLKTSECYFQKSYSGFSNHSLSMSNELALYIFYDALLKYKLIIDDEDLFPEYLEQIEKLFRKLDRFEDIRFGIHQLIAKIAAYFYDLHGWRGEERNQLIQLIYDKYVLNGYYFHGFHSVYKEDIQKSGFTPEYYDNFYTRFLKVNGIFQKYKLGNVIHKDFMGTEVSFTDDALLGCYYSMYAPMFFTNFMMNSNLFGKKVQMEDYLKGDFDASVQPLKKFMSQHSFKEKDKQFILDLVQDEWNLLHSKNQELCMIMIPRKRLGRVEIPVEEFFRDDEDIFEVIDRLLSSKCNSVSSNEYLSKKDFEIVSFPNYYEQKNEKALIIEPEVEYPNKERRNNRVLSNAYGRASALLLVGSLSISFGVILSILTVLGG